MSPMELAFNFLKGSIASWKPEDETGQFEGLRLLDPKFIEQGRAGAPVAIEGDSSRFEEDASDLGRPTVPGWAEGEYVAGTWLSPNIINPLAKPDFNMLPSDQAALIGSYVPPDWWRKQQLAPYGEGMKFHGIPDRELRQIDLPRGTQLGDINEAAQALMEDRKPRNVYQSGRWGGERVPEVHDILSQMNLPNIPPNRYSTFNPWKGKPVTSIPPKDPDRDWRDEFDMKVASEPMDLAWRLLKGEEFHPSVAGYLDNVDARGESARMNPENPGVEIPIQQPEPAQETGPPIPEKRIELGDWFWDDMMHTGGGHNQWKTRNISDVEKEEVKERVTTGLQGYINPDGSWNDWALKNLKHEGFDNGRGPSVGIRTHLFGPDGIRKDKKGGYGDSIIAIVNAHSEKGATHPGFRTVMYRNSKYVRDKQSFLPKGDGEGQHSMGIDAKNLVDHDPVESTKNNMKPLHGVSGKERKNWLSRLRKGEPMDLAWRLLKDEDEQFISRSDGLLDDAFGGMTTTATGVTPYDELNERQRRIADLMLNAPPSYWNDPASGEYETEEYAHLFGEGHETIPDEEYDNYENYLRYYFEAVDNLPEEERDESGRIISNHLDIMNDPDHEERPHNIAEKKAEAASEAAFMKRRLAELLGPDFEKKAEPMDIAMRLLKAPYDIDGEVFDRLYQGGREGDPDSGYWPISHQEALTYAMMGSDQDKGMRADGVPQIRVAPETDEMHYLNSDPETSMVGMTNPNTIPHEIQSRGETARDIEELLTTLHEPWAEPEHDIDHPHNEMQSDIAPFMDTGARDVSNKKRIAHIEEMLNRVRTGEPMDIAMRLLKDTASEEYQQNQHRNFLRDILAQKYRQRMFDEGTPEKAMSRMAGPPMYSDAHWQDIEAQPKRYDLKRWQRGYGHLLPEEKILQYANPFYNGPWDVPKEMGTIPFDSPEWEELREKLQSKPVMTGEPMDLAWRLLKDRKSPEAFQHKKEYDTKYESSPERIKYREELNRERRKRGMYGDHSHRDISHTQGNKLSIEDEHSNRARHFKDRGTLRNA